MVYDAGGGEAEDEANHRQGAEDGGIQRRNLGSRSSKSGLLWYVPYPNDLSDSFVSDEVK